MAQEYKPQPCQSKPEPWVTEQPKPKPVTEQPVVDKVIGVAKQLLEELLPLVDALGFDRKMFNKLKGDHFGMKGDVGFVRRAIVNAGDQPLPREVQFELAHKLSRIEGVLEAYFLHVEIQKWDQLFAMAPGSDLDAASLVGVAKSVAGLIEAWVKLRGRASGFANSHFSGVGDALFDDGDLVEGSGKCCPK